MKKIQRFFKHNHKVTSLAAALLGALLLFGLLPFSRTAARADDNGPVAVASADEHIFSYQIIGPVRLGVTVGSTPDKWDNDKDAFVADMQNMEVEMQFFNNEDELVFVLPFGTTGTFVPSSVNISNNWPMKAYSLIIDDADFFKGEFELTPEQYDLFYESGITSIKLTLNTTGIIPGMYPNGYSAFALNRHIFIQELGSLPLPPDPVKEHYNFTGWYLDPECTQLYDGRRITEDMDLYAGWEAIVYTLQFVTNGGNRIDDLEFTVETGYTMPADPTREGYTFLDWYMDAELETEFDPEFIGNMTLYADWKINVYTVRFFVDGELYKEFEVEFGTRLTEIAQEIKQETHSNVIMYGVSLDGIVKADMEIEGGLIMTNNGKIITHFQDNWIIYTMVAAVVVITLIIAVVLAIKRRVGDD